MKFKLFISIILFANIYFMNAQNYYYYYKGEKVNLTLDTNTSSDNKIYFKRSNSAKSIPISNIFYVKLHNANDFSLLKQIANQKDVSIVHKNSFMPLWYKLKLNTNNDKSSLEVCNEFYETGDFADVDPAFMFDFDNSCSNDSDFGNLWGLNNTSNSNIDINICDAWSITEGNGVNVAVLDQGIDKTHNDLNDNISSLSFDAQNGTSPSVFTNGRSHGTHVAGTIGAEKDNNLQVVGVAPQSEIMSISHTLSITPDISEELADGINWAWQNGAHIINNSWGDQGGQFFNQLHSALLENAINNALDNGRNGLGTILIFASGNQSPAIDYPANSNPNIITVGAITSVGNRSNFSGFGNELDVVAPGSNILSTIPNQDTVSWNGTSMAAPHVAGVAALILSVNPNLSVQEVNDIIESTAQKVGNYNYSNNSNRPNGTWNNEMGYGLVDAYAAVQMAQSYSNATLEAISYVCDDNKITLNLSDNNNNLVTWQTSSNLSIVAQSNSAITVKANSSNSSGSGWVKATLSNGKVLLEGFDLLVPPEITFPDTALHEALLNGSGTVDYQTYNIKNGDIIFIDLNTLHQVTTQWKHTKIGTIPELNNNKGEVFIDGDTTLPYQKCWYINSDGKPTEDETNSLEGLFPLKSYYFTQPSQKQVSLTSSPPIHMSNDDGLVEVEVTARNPCGCDTKVNSYLVMPESRYETGFRTNVIVSPNPAKNVVNVSIKTPGTIETIMPIVPEYQKLPIEIKIIGLPEDPFSSNKTYEYDLMIYNYFTAEKVYQSNFNLIEPLEPTQGYKSVEKTININTSPFQDGLYIVHLISKTEKASGFRTLIIKK